jgi:serine/threonine protein kinase
MNVDHPPDKVSDTTQSLASGAGIKKDSLELVEDNVIASSSVTQRLTSTSSIPSSFSTTTSKSLLQPTPSTNTSQEWPADPSMYQLVGKIGQGAFATVWKAYRVNPSAVTTSTTSTTTTTKNTTSDGTSIRTGAIANDKSNDATSVSTSAICTDLPPVSSSSTAANMTPCAVKVLNLDHADTTNLSEIRLEVQAMRLLSHPNVLPCHTAFVNDRNLWLITPLMEKGSSLHALQSIRKTLRRHRRQLLQQQQQQQQSNDSTTTPHISSSSLSVTPPIQSASSLPISSIPYQPIQMEQHIMYILHETLVGLQYIHENLQIHRDIKAGNILIDVNGNIKIADFGVSSFLLLTNNGSLYQHEKAKTFVGTPCWMAPVRVTCFVFIIVLYTSIL